MLSGGQKCSFLHPDSVFDGFNVLLSFLAEKWYRSNMKLPQKASFGSETCEMEPKVAISPVPPEDSPLFYRALTHIPPFSETTTEFCIIVWKRQIKPYTKKQSFCIKPMFLPDKNKTYPFRCSVKEGGILGGKPCPPDTPHDTYGPSSHVSGPKLSFWRNFQMILHGFAWRSSQNTVLRQKNKHWTNITNIF